MLSKSDWPQDYGEQFWELYPRRVSKKYAMTVLERIRKSGEVPFEVLLSAVKVYGRSVVGKDMKYVAHPASWLNAGRWDDDPDALLDTKVAPQVIRTDNGKFLIRRGSLQAKAWAKHRGKDFPWGPSGVWAVDSEYPSEEMTVQSGK